MHFFKGLLTGIAATFVFAFFYTTYTHPSLTTVNFLAVSFFQVLPFIYNTAIICGACVFLFWFYGWWKNNAAEIAEEEINRARDRAEEIKYDAHSAAAAFRADNEKECTRLRMEVVALHAAAKKEYDLVTRMKQELEQSYADKFSALEANFDAKKSAYITEISALISKNKDLQSSYGRMIANYKGILAENGLASSGGKYDKRAENILAKTHYSTPAIENILHGNEP